MGKNANAFTDRWPIQFISAYQFLGAGQITGDRETLRKFAVRK